MIKYESDEFDILVYMYGFQIMWMFLAATSNTQEVRWVKLSTQPTPRHSLATPWCSPTPIVFSWWWDYQFIRFLQGVLKISAFSDSREVLFCLKEKESSYLSFTVLTWLLFKWVEIFQIWEVVDEQVWSCRYIVAYYGSLVCAYYIVTVAAISLRGLMFICINLRTKE